VQILILILFYNTVPFVGKYVIAWISLASVFYRLGWCVMQWHASEMRVISVREHALRKYEAVNKINVEQYRKGKLCGTSLTQLQQYVTKESQKIQKRLELLEADLNNTNITTSVIIRSFQIMCLFLGEPVLLKDSIIATINTTYDHQTNIYGHHQCAICLEDFQEGCHISTLEKCKHTFHKSCLELWIQRAWSCPICRQVSSEVYYHHVPTWKEKVWDSDLVYILRCLWFKFNSSTQWFLSKPNHIWMYPILFVYHITFIWRSYVGTWLGWCYLASHAILSQSFDLILLHFFLVFIQIGSFMGLINRFKHLEPEISSFLRKNFTKAKENWEAEINEMADPASKLEKENLFFRALRWWFRFRLVGVLALAVCVWCGFGLQCPRAFLAPVVTLVP